MIPIKYFSIILLIRFRFINGNSNQLVIYEHHYLIDSSILFYYIFSCVQGFSWPPLNQCLSFIFDQI